MLVDTHCHIDFDEFNHDRSTVLERAQSLGVSDIIVPSVAKSSWFKTIQVCDQFSQLHLALGLHPIFIDQHQPQDLLELNRLINRHNPVAVGEIGLDFYNKSSDKDKQTAFFSKQLIIAKQHDLPVIIHNRKAHDECLSALKRLKLKGGIIHAFNGSMQQAEMYIELGFLLGFGGMLTYQRSRKSRSLVKQIPIKHLVLETDAPDMSVEQHRGERNSPEYLPLILDSVSHLTGRSKKDLAVTLNENFKRMFYLLNVG